MAQVNLRFLLIAEEIAGAYISKWLVIRQAELALEVL
jgi:hypothetical protein